MRLISESKELLALFQKNLKWCDSLSFATAWASPIKGLFEKLLENRNKIQLAVVGIHFYQTDPRFIKEFIDSQKVLFIMQTSGTYHPKMYLFEKGSEWRMIVGSANFTNAAFSENSEVNVLITNKDDSEGTSLTQAKNILASYKKKAETFDKKKYENYKATWNRQQTRIRILASEYGEKKKGSAKNASQPTFLYDLSWNDFFTRVKEEDRKESGRFKKRRDLLKTVKDIFQQKEPNGDFKRFSNYTIDERKLIAGLKNDTWPEWGLFGSMQGAGMFKSYVSKESEKLSDALECIPREGRVEKTHYDKYIAKLSKLPRINLGTASRLLAMKRPDTFVCVDGENSDGLSKFLRISNIMHKGKDAIFEIYWENVIQRIKELNWWNEEKPANETEGFVWENRAAFIDSLFYRK